MFDTVQTNPIRITANTRRFGILSWLVRWNAAYRERAQIACLTEDQRRDMGLSASQTEKITVAEIMSRDAG